MKCHVSTLDELLMSAQLTLFVLKRMEYTREREKENIHASASNEAEERTMRVRNKFY